MSNHPTLKCLDGKLWPKLTGLPCLANQATSLGRWKLGPSDWEDYTMSCNVATVLLSNTFSFSYKFYSPCSSNLNIRKRQQQFFSLKVLAKTLNTSNFIYLRLENENDTQVLPEEVYSRVFLLQCKFSLYHRKCRQFRSIIAWFKWYTCSKCFSSIKKIIIWFIFIK